METVEMEKGMEWRPESAPTQAEELKAARRHFSRIGLSYLIGTALFFGIQYLAIYLAGLLRPELLKNGNTYLLTYMLPTYLISMPALYLIVKRIPAKAPERRAMKPGHFVLAAIMAFALMYAVNLVGVIITTLIGFFKQSQVQNGLMGIVMTTNPLVMLLIMVICAPIMEELLFRKLIVDRTVRYGQGVAVVLSGLMFGLFHGNLNQFLYATALGMFLAFLYVKTGNLKITIAIHMLVNLMGSVVSSSVLKLLDMEELLRAQAGGTRDGAMTEYVFTHMAGLMIYIGYAFLILGITIAGGVLLIVFAAKRRFTLERGEVVIPRGKRFRTVILNVGMTVYCVVWIGMIVYLLLR